MESTTNSVSTNLVQGILRLKNNNPSIGPIRPARSIDAKVLQETAKNIAQGISSSRELLLTTGFGMHRDLKIPVRLPALIIPGLNVMERMDDAGLPVPKYVVYQATDFIAETNDLPKDKALECASQMERYLRDYVRVFHSRVAENVQFEFGCDYPAECKKTIDDTVLTIRSMMMELDDVKTAMNQISESETKHSNGSNKSHAYAAANVLYSGALREYPFKQDGVKTVLPIGGIAEKPFFAVTSAHSDRLDERHVVPMLTQIGSRPTYFYYGNSGDPLSAVEYAQATKEAFRDGPIRFDLNAMIADGASPDQIAEIYPKQI